MLRIFVGCVVLMLGAGAWIGFASWRWATIDPAAVFRARINTEMPSGSKIGVAPGSIVWGDVNDDGKLVCGTVWRPDAARGRSEATYSMIVIKTLFGYRINDGYTPATRPDNQAVSDQTCAELRAHAALHSSAGHS